MTNENVLDKMIGFARQKGKTGVDLKTIDPAKMAQVIKAEEGQVGIIQGAIVATFGDFPNLAHPKVDWSKDSTWQRLRAEILSRVAAKPAQVEIQAAELVDPFAEEELEVTVKQLASGETPPPSEETQELRDEIEMYAARQARNAKVYIYDQQGILNSTGGKVIDMAVKIALREGVAKARQFVDEQIDDTAGYSQARQALLQNLKGLGWTTAGRDAAGEETDHSAKVLGNADFANAINRLKAGWSIERVLRALKITGGQTAANGKTRTAAAKPAAELDPFGSPA